MPYRWTCQSVSATQDDKGGRAHLCGCTARTLTPRPRDSASCTWPEACDTRRTRTGVVPAYRPVRSVRAEVVSGANSSRMWEFRPRKVTQGPFARGQGGESRRIRGTLGQAAKATRVGERRRSKRRCVKGSKAVINHGSGQPSTLFDPVRTALTRPRSTPDSPSSSCLSAQLPDRSPQPSSLED